MIDAQTTTLAPHHLQKLTDSAVSLDVATEAGVRSLFVATDFPAEIRQLADLAPGMLFNLTTHDGRVIPQFRPDVPPEGCGKYLQQKGSGSIVTVHPRMGTRMDAETLLIVEGTKQYLSAVSHAADDILVAGIQGCTGWTHDGVPLPDLDVIATGRKRIVIAFDADVASNIDVWSSANRLRTHLSNIAPDAKIVFATTGGGAKAGLDDYLGGRQDPAAALAGVIANAKPTIGAKPPRAHKSSTTDVVVDWEGGRIVEAVDGEVQGGRTLLGAAVLISATRFIDDDLNRIKRSLGKTWVEHDLRIAIGKVGTTERVETTVYSVPDDQLIKVGTWLAAVPGGRGTHVAVPETNADTVKAINAVRSCGSEYDETYYVRTGLVVHEGRPAYLFADGALGAEGLVEGLGAYLTGSAAHTSLPDPTASKEAAANAIRELLAIEGVLGDATPWQAIIGAATYAVTGADPIGALGIEGKRGSGKTTLLHIANSMFGAALSGKPMCSLNSTRGIVGDAYAGLHNALLTVDDARVRHSVGKASEESDGLDLAVRIAYDGPAAARARKIQDARGKWIDGTVDQSWPQVIVSAETFDSLGEVKSTLERMLILKVSTQSTWTSTEALTRVQDLAAGGTYALAMAAIISCLLRTAETACMAEGKGFEDALGYLREQSKERRAEEGAILKERVATLTPRMAQVAAGPIAGYRTLLEIAVSAGILTEAEAKEKIKRMRASIAQTIGAHSVLIDGEGQCEADVMLARIQGLLVGGRYTIKDVEGSQERIGAEVTTGGRRCVALLSHGVAKALNLPESTVKHTLADRIFADDKQMARQVKIDGMKTRALCVPVEYFFGKEDRAKESDDGPF